MIEIRNNGNDEMRVSSRRVGGLKVQLIVVAAAANTDLAESALNLQNLNVVVSLTRQNSQGATILKHDVIPNSNMECLASVSSFGTAEWDQIGPGITGNAGYTILKAKGVGIKEVGMKTFVIPFGGPVDCSLPGTELCIEANTTDLFTADATNAECYLYITPLYTQAPEKYLPVLFTDYIQASKNNYTANLPGLVREITYINLTEVDNLSTNRALLSMAIDSDDFSETYDTDDLIALRMDQFETITSANERFQSFRVLPWQNDVMKQNTKITASLNGANIEVNANIFGAWYAVPSASSVRAFSSYQEAQAIMVNNLASQLNNQQA